jgi:hypothetical protein
MVKDNNYDLFAALHNLLNRWKNHFSQLLNVHRVSDVTQRRINWAGPLVPNPSPSEAEIAIVILERYKSPDIDKILADPIQTGGETSCSQIHKFITSIWDKEELH